MKAVKKTKDNTG